MVVRSFVNQCPIAANNSFLYNFDVPGQAGTFWYHSHLGMLYQLSSSILRKLKAVRQLLSTATVCVVHLFSMTQVGHSVSS